MHPPGVAPYFVSVHHPTNRRLWLLEKFQCPDGKTILVADCLKKCRMGERCLTLPTLVLISQERDWKGKASTTQLLNGTMLEYLKLSQPYTVSPDSRAFMLQGTKHHRALEEVAKELGLASEIPLSIDRDIFDLVEVEDGQIVLTDYKLWGSFKVAKSLGLTKVGSKPDPSGVVYKRDSKYGKAGDSKRVNIYAQVPENADNWEVEYQLNRYRVMLEGLGVKINKMQLQVTVRDGGLMVASSRGLDRNTYRIPIRLIPNQEVIDYFDFKADCLRKALAYGWTEPCTTRECWDGIRCSRFCDVAQFCPKGQLIQKLDRDKEERYA